jgi:predicted lipoprotein with Yx(FWY)xxD motif
MRTSRPALAASLPVTALLTVLVTAACGTTAAVPGAAYGTTAPATPSASASMSASAPASASGAPMIPAKAVLTVQKTKIGYVLATGTGMTVYWFSKDAKGGTSACTGTCATSWPAVTGTPVPAAGVTLTGKLGTITRPGGVVQATYNGYPLYTYAGDMSPGQTSGNGAGGAWHVITGTLLSPSPASAAAASARDLSAGGGVAPAPSSSATAAGVSGY